MKYIINYIEGYFPTVIAEDIIKTISIITMIQFIMKKEKRGSKTIIISNISTYVIKEQF